MAGTGLSFKCVIGDCQDAFRVEGQFVSHLNKKHLPLTGEDLLMCKMVVSGLTKCSQCNHVCNGRQGVACHVSKKHRLVASSQQSVVAPPSFNGTEGGVADTVVRELSGDTVPVAGEALAAASDGGTFSAPSDLGLEEVKTLLSLFGRTPNIRNHWAKPLQVICGVLIKGIVKDLESATDRVLEEYSTLAFLLLPGLISEAMRSKKSSINSLLTSLRDCALAENGEFSLPLKLVRMAQDWKDVVIARNRIVGSEARSRIRNQRRLPRVALCKRITALVAEKRLSAAAKLLEQYAVWYPHQEGLTRQQDLGVPSELSESSSAAAAVTEDLDWAKDCVLRLHPAASDKDDISAFDEVGDVCPPLRVNMTDMEKILHKLPVGSTGGVSGWTPGLIRAIFLEDGGKVYACRLVNAMLSGSLSSSLWTQSRMVLLPKCDGGHRPLGIGEAWYRLAGRVAVYLVGEATGAKLMPLQLGCSTKGGCEIGARLGQTIMQADPRLALAVLDIKNAFNSIWRSLILRGLKEFCKELIPWFKWAYGGQSDLIDSSGEFLGKSCSGCRQGDPLGPLLFCVGFQATLVQVHEMIKEVLSDEATASHYVDLPAGVFAYMDDATIYAPIDVIDTIARRLTILFDSDQCLTLSVEKCRYLSFTGVNTADLRLREGASPVFNVAENGGWSILGNPSGSVEFVAAEVERKIKMVEECVPLLADFPGWVGWNLLRHCLTAKVGYLARVVEPRGTLKFFDSFDQEVDKMIFCLADFAPNGINALEVSIVKTLRSLPMRMGGLGIPRYSGLAGEAATLQSRQFCYEYMENHLDPMLLGGAHQYWDGIQLGAREDGWLKGVRDGARRGPFVLASGQTNWSAYDDGVGLVGRGLNVTRGNRTSLRRGAEVAQPREFEREAPTSHPEVKSVKSMVQAIHFSRCHALSQFLMCSTAANKYSEGQWLRNSVFRGSGQWLAGPGGWLYGHYCVRDPVEYRAAFRQRVLLPPCVLPVSVPSALGAAGFSIGMEARCCPLCGESEKWKAELPFHFCHCKAQQSFFKYRHNRARDLLADYVQREMVGAGGLVRVEQLVATVLEQDQPPVDSIQQVQLVVEGQDHPPVQVVRHQAQPQATRRAIVPPRADVVVTRENGASLAGVRFIDVSIVDVTSPSYRPNGARRYASVRDEFLASKMREDEKIYRYRNEAGTNCPDFLPFVVEATGRLGPAAEKWLKTHWDSLQGEEKFVSRFIFISQLGGLIARSNAQMALAWSKAVVKQASTPLRV